MNVHPHINKAQYQAIQHRFLRYVKGFAKPPKHRDQIVLKIKHSIRVEKEIEALAMGIGLNRNQSRLAKVIGLLHDIGRFEQYKGYETFSDRDSVDHGNFGVQVIHKTEILADIDEDLQPIIKYAVTNHNQLRLPEHADVIYQLHAKLIRDADKLDIFRILCSGGNADEKDALAAAFNIEFQSREISPQVADAVLSHQTVKMKYVKSYFDLILLRMAWVFDMNFRQTLKRFHQQGYLSVMHQALPKTLLVNRLNDCIQSYVEKKIEI